MNNIDIWIVNMKWIMFLGNLYIIYYILSIIKYNHLLRLIFLYELLCAFKLIASYLIDYISWDFKKWFYFVWL